MVAHVCKGFSLIYSFEPIPNNARPDPFPSVFSVPISSVSADGRFREHSTRERPSVGRDTLAEHAEIRELTGRIEIKHTKIRFRARHQVAPKTHPLGRSRRKALPNVHPFLPEHLRRAEHSVDR